MTTSDPIVLTTLAFGVPFLGYFTGIVIRKTALDRPGSLTLGRQLLVGIPVSLVTVPPLTSVIQKALSQPTDMSVISSCLVNLGVVIVAGMSLPEAAATLLQKWIHRNDNSEPPIPPRRPTMKRSVRAEREKEKVLDGRGPGSVA